MKWKQLIDAVEVWADVRGIDAYSTPEAQLLKAVSEMGELCDAEVKGDLDDQQDAVGDVLVCLIIYCYMSDLDLRVCLESAYNEIKDRTGRMILGGVWVKDE